MASSAGTGNTAPTLTTITVLVFLWALVSYFIRLYVKLSQSDGWKPDDWAITGAMAAALAQLVAMCYAVHRGYGSSWEVMAASDRVAVEQSLYASQVLYIASVGAAKISASCFIASVLARDKRNVFISQLLTGLCGLWTFASILAISLRGDISQPWDTYNRSQIMYIRWIGVEASGLILDLVAAAVIALFIYDLQMKTSKKLTVSAILNCRLLLAVPIAFRLYYLHPSAAGKDSNSSVAEMIRQVIIGCNIMFAALTCLKPFLRPFDTAAFGSHASRSGLFRYTNQPDKNTTYYELSANNATNRSMTGTAGNRKSMVMQSQRSVAGAEDDEIPLTDNAAAARLGAVGHTTEVRHSETGGSGYGKKSIAKTQTWAVSVDS